MTTSASPFVPMENVNWNRDSAVLRHELGHAVVWFVHGGGIGRLRYVRASDGLLEGGMGSGPAPDQTDTPAFRDAVAERLLAGEVAARVHLGLPGGCISLRKLHANRLPMGILPMEIAATLTESPVADVTRVLSLADEYHRQSWRAWILERLHATETLVRNLQAVIETTANQFAPRLPIHDWSPPLLVPGVDLIRILSQNGARPNGRSPVAL